MNKNNVLKSTKCSQQNDFVQLTKISFSVYRNSYESHCLTILHYFNFLFKKNFNSDKKTQFFAMLQWYSSQEKQL